MDTVFEDAKTAIARVRDGDTVMCGGFGPAGLPVRLIDALLESGRRDLTIISNNLGQPGKGLGALLRAGQVRRVVGSFFSGNPEVAAAQRDGGLEVTLLPQGTLAEAIRAGGAGIPAFYTPTGAGTVLAEGKESRVFEDGRTYLLERALKADVALVHANRSDRLGNLLYRGVAQNFNLAMATAARLVIAEVDEVVPAGELAPAEISTAHLYVDVVAVPQ
ncbi:CoA transferase subunit A [Streptomyces sp. NPDC058614]|uniref:CoA transferase subunit A n=1 Tax=Streptomyces sp. NPDC058614 TaxID=3346557 RepID=UPI003646F9AD